MFRLLPTWFGCSARFYLRSPVVADTVAALLLAPVAAFGLAFPFRLLYADTGD